MHILFIAGMDPRGGEAQGMRQTIEGIRKYCPSLKVSVVLPKGTRWKKYYKEMANSFRSIGYDVYQEYYVSAIQNIPLPQYRVLIKYPIRLLQYLYGRYIGSLLISRKINWNTIDVIHANSSREDMGAILALRHKKPLIWHIREYGDIDYKCFCYRKKYIELMNKTSYLLVAMSDAIRLHWINKGVLADRIVTVYDGIDERIVQKSDYIKKTTQQVRFVILGSVQETKGQNRLVEALGKISNERITKLHVDIVGGLEQSDFVDKLQRRVDELRLNDIVTFQGYKENFRERLFEYDCGLMCSRSEAFGFVTVEYMAAGLPVIAAATGANPEIVIDGKVGLLYNPEVPNDLAEKMEVFVDTPSLCEIMGRNAAEYVHDRYSIKRCVETLYEIYKKASDSNMKNHD